MGPTLRQFYARLSQTFGLQRWWPGDTAFEIIIGAILTQNTNWRNVERAIIRLKEHRLLNPEALHRLRIAELAVLIRPAGTFNVKACRIKNFLHYLFECYQGDLTAMHKRDTSTLRREILTVKGIGPETADAILLYAFDRPVFVVDAYTKRVLYRHGLIAADAGYDDIQEMFYREHQPDTQLFNEYHALFVRVGKAYCRPVPRCEECPLRDIAYSLSQRCDQCYQTLAGKDRLKKSNQSRCGNCQESEQSVM